MTRSVTLKSLRPRLPRIVEEIDSKMDRFIITKRGRPVALMISIEDYESMLETLDILSNTKLMKKIKRAEADIKKGNLKALDRIERDLKIA